MGFTNTLKRRYNPYGVPLDILITAFYLTVLKPKNLEISEINNDRCPTLFIR